MTVVVEGHWVTLMEQRTKLEGKRRKSQEQRRASRVAALLQNLQRSDFIPPDPVDLLTETPF